MSLKRARSSTPSPHQSIFTSAPINDRSSKFIAFYSPTLTAKEIQAQSEIETATHRIAAWRKTSSQLALSSQRLFDTGHDDDGEKYGGKTLAAVMAAMDAEGAVVVARWYGGVMLGPVRFDHMKTCAREAISEYSHETERVAKKLKTQADGESKDRLVGILQERDQSITVLRGLLAEKSQPSSSGVDGKGTSAKAPDYANMPLATLQKLEQVRDATIGWILKGIEKAEAAQQTKSTADPAVADAASTTKEEKSELLETLQTGNKEDIGVQSIDHANED